MSITPEESEAYNDAEKFRGSFNWAVTFANLRTALRRHVAAEMRLEWAMEHRCMKQYWRDYLHCTDPRHDFLEADWDRAADKALMGEATK